MKTERGIGSIICVTNRHGPAIDMIWNQIALPATRLIMEAGGPETEAFIPALDIADVVISASFEAAGGWPALEKSGCKLA